MSKASFSLVTPLGVTLTGLVISASSLGMALSAEAAVLRIDQGAFTPDAGLITFSEFPGGTNNPTYSPSNYGGAPTAPTVSFGGFFLGQSFAANPSVSCPGGAASGCVVGIPSSLLTLDPASPRTFITGDGANPTSPVLSGTPTFNGPVSVLFSKDISGVGLDGGFFNAIGGTSIKAFSRSGQLLGEVLNKGLGIEFLGLVTDNGSDQIAGLQFSLVGAEPAGFAIDNLRFGTAGQVQVPGGGGTPVPEPSSIVGSIFAVYGMFRLRKQKQSASKVS